MKVSEKNELFRFVQVRPLGPADVSDAPAPASPDAPGDNTQPDVVASDPVAIEVASDMAFQIDALAKEDAAGAASLAQEALTRKDQITKLLVDAAAFAAFVQSQPNLSHTGLVKLTNKRVPADKLPEATLAQMHSRAADTLAAARYIRPGDAPVIAAIERAIRAIHFVRAVRTGSSASAQLLALLEAPVVIAAQALQDTGERSLVNARIDARSRIPAGPGLFNPTLSNPGVASNTSPTLTVSDMLVVPTMAGF